MAQLYVLGGKQRKLTLKQEEEWSLYESALILKVDTDSGAVRVCVECKTPAEARANKTSSCITSSRRAKRRRSHPNFVFELGPDVWATRFE